VSQLGHVLVFRFPWILLVVLVVVRPSPSRDPKCDPDRARDRAKHPLTWSGRRDSNPRPPPWQGSWAGSSDLRRPHDLVRELGVFVRVQWGRFASLPVRSRDPDGTPTVSFTRGPGNGLIP